MPKIPFRDSAALVTMSTIAMVVTPLARVTSPVVKTVKAHKEEAVMALGVAATLTTAAVCYKKIENDYNL